MKISKKSDYALRALMLLADLEPGDLISIRRLAERADIPKRFLEQIMIDLRERGWVKAVTGRDGGFQLAVPAEELTMGQVVRHFDGVLAPVGCVSVTHYEPCSQEKVCRFRRVFLDARNHAARMLDSLTLADLRHIPPVENSDLAGLSFHNGDGI
jgi:Rrf2 family protein